MACSTGIRYANSVGGAKLESGEEIEKDRLKFPIKEDALKKKKHLDNLLERILTARPDASNETIRNLAPDLRDLGDEALEKLVTPIRNRLAATRKT